MAQEIINVGLSPNDGLGDPIRTSFIKCNNNFGELYSRVQSEPPVTLVGSIGDVAGMTAYDSLYFYYCFQDFDGSSIIWNQVPHSGNAQITTLTVSGDALVGGNVDVSGNITGTYLFGNGAGITGVVAAPPTSISNGSTSFTTLFNGNATVSAGGVSDVVTVTGAGIAITGNTTTSGNVITTGNISGGNVVATTLIAGATLTASGNVNSSNVNATANIIGGNVTGGNITATGFLFGDGGFLSNVTVTSNVAVTSIQNGTSSIQIGSAGGNAVVAIAGLSNVARFTTSGFSTSGDLYAGGSTSVVGNITGGNLLVTGGGIVSTTGNITGGNLNATTGVSSSTVVATGNITGGNLKTSSVLIDSTNISGVTALTASGNITGGNLKTSGVTINSTSITATTISASGNVTGGNLLAGSGIVSTSGNVIAGNVSTSGTINADGNITGGNFLSSGLVNVNGSITGNGTLTINATNSAAAIINGGTDGVGNIGSSAKTFNTVFAKATTAQYADLAEKYLADADYEPGTVLSFGGSAEVTVSTQDNDTLVAGVVSTKPAYQMNSALEGDHVVALALTGRVPVKVQGSVTPGAMMVSAGNGRARAEKNPAMGTVIGKALEGFSGSEGTIEVVVGRL